MKLGSMMPSEPQRPRSDFFEVFEAFAVPHAHRLLDYSHARRRPHPASSRKGVLPDGGSFRTACSATRPPPHSPVGLAQASRHSGPSAARPRFARPRHLGQSGSKRDASCKIMIAQHSGRSVTCIWRMMLYRCLALLYNPEVIKSFRHAGLKTLFIIGTSSIVRPDLLKRALRRMDALDQAASLADLNLPGLHLHRLKGKPMRHTLHVNGPWCITFEWIDGDAYRVDLEQYH